MAMLVDSNILVFLASPQAPLHQQTWDVIRELKRRGEALHIIA